MPQMKYNCKLVSLFVLIPMALDVGFVDGGLDILPAVSFYFVTYLYSYALTCNDVR